MQESPGWLELQSQPRGGLDPIVKLLHSKSRAMADAVATNFVGKLTSNLKQNCSASAAYAWKYICNAPQNPTLAGLKVCILHFNLL